MRRQNKAGGARRAAHVSHSFTLIELLVVVLVLGVLLSVALPTYRRGTRTTVVPTVKTNLRTIALAAQAYRMKHGHYPSAYTNRDRSGAVLPLPNDGFVGANGDLQSVPSGPRTVWYEWAVGTDNENRGQFVVKANEGGENLWGDSEVTTNYAAYNLEQNKYYMDGGNPLR